ncbi:phage terminase small subunit [Edaphobacter lichenicola]|uniref:Phage terminase small subunit n=1 Tax=Tunturiibacter empetritectus TaxID=3069691 RepID=A0A7W8MTY6_9BACT|nr:phage terminase small subunit [Edaphobacter lichenicola]
MLPSNAHGHVGSMRVKVIKQHPLGTSHRRMFPVAMVALLAAAFGFNPAARAQDAATTWDPGDRFNRPGITQHRRVTQWKQSDC